MRIKNRLFPYPVLNNDKKLSDYRPDISFELCFESTSDEKFLRLNNIHLESNDDYIKCLMNEGKLKGVLIIECSQTVFRRKEELTLEPQSINIPKDCFNGDIELSAFVYASEDIDKYSNVNYKDEYEDYDFKIEKYCILAADDGFTIKVENQPENERKKSSIFIIARDCDIQESIIRYVMGERKITIYLPDKYYDYYNSSKYSQQFKNASFATIAIPALSECIAKIQDLLKKNADYSIEDACLDYSWLRSIRNAYFRERNAKLTEEELKTISPMELAQIVLNYASCNGVDEIHDVIINGANTDIEEEETDE